MGDNDHSCDWPENKINVNNTLGRHDRDIEALYDKFNGLGTKVAVMWVKMAAMTTIISAIVLGAVKAFFE